MTTLHPEIVWTEAGFRRIEDCQTEWIFRDWHDGHYWSARPVLDCSAGDVPYLAGKVPPVTLEPGDLFAASAWIEPWASIAAPTQPEPFFRPNLPLEAYASPSVDAGVGFFSSTLAIVSIPYSAPPDVPPVPLPGAWAAMLLAITMVAIVGRITAPRGRKEM